MSEPSNETSSKITEIKDIERELAALKNGKLTDFNEATGHYELPAQRSCFLRCAKCVNFSEMDSYEKNGEWVIATECQFCVQRAVDMLGYSEHKITPSFSLHDTPKSRKRLDPNNIYELLEAAAARGNFDVD